MYLIGLTGGIGSGKSTVAARMVERGARLIDADAIAREVVEPGQPAYDDIVAAFGPAVVGPDGALDRAALGRIVFADDDRRALLNRLTHPRVGEEIAARLAEIATSEPSSASACAGLVVIDVPLLVETGQDRGYQAVVVVATHPDTQVARLVAGRGMDAADARARIAAQATLEEKLARATHVIWNEGSLDELRRRTDEVVDELIGSAQA